MKDRFRDILDIEDVHGVIFLGFNGKMIYSEFVIQRPQSLDDINWLLFVHALDGVGELELIFENSRYFLRRTASGFIIVIMGEIALIEMVRLNCDILLPTFEKTESKPKGLRRFFNI